MSGHEDIGGDHDPLTQKIHEVLDQVIESQQAMLGVAEIVKRIGSTTQKVQIETKGMGAWGGAACATCFVTFLALILFAGDVRDRFAAERDARAELAAQVRDLKAWQQVHQNKIAILESQLKERAK